MPAITSAGAVLAAGSGLGTRLGDRRGEACIIGRLIQVRVRQTDQPGSYNCMLKSLLACLGRAVDDVGVTVYS